MRKIYFTSLIGLLFLLLLGGCKKGSVTNTEIAFSFEELMQLGWAAFEQGNYLEAKEKFYEAKMKNPLEKEVYNGLGWSYFKLDSLEQADREFNICFCLFEPTADISAGWAFTLNALKTYGESNEKADSALVLNPSWVFSHGLMLDSRTLVLLKAENYYLLGLFAQSLAEVQILNPDFISADVTTDIGRTQLAAEIERLKGEV
jgi:tetratricopeptide (TPR) repeat protein